MSATAGSFVRPGPLEIAAGVLAGLEDGPVAREVPGGGTPRSARQALEQAILPALLRAPCVVDFSGGRDSSVVLAVATHVARREGLPVPVPFTRRFPLEPMADEAAWQELVVEHLRLPNWERAELTEDLDLIGKRAQQSLRRFGLLVPSPHYSTLSFELANGGSRLTGDGGDEVFGSYRARTVLAMLRSPKRLRHRRDLVSLLSGVAPRPARDLLLWREHLSRLPCGAWMRPEVLRRFARRYAAEYAREPISWRGGLDWQLRRRHFSAIQRNGSIIAAVYNVQRVDPFLDPRFVRALGHSASMLGFADRTEAMTFVAGDLLPSSLLSRRTKGAYNRAFFTKISRSFAEGWDGSGVDEELVDPHALKRAWLKPLPPAPSGTLLQAAWMAQQHVPLEGAISTPPSHEAHAERVVNS